MALIRQANAARATRDAIVLDLGDLVRQGEAMKLRARAEAEQILADARDERARLIKGAAEEGRQEGLAQGLEEGRKSGHAEGQELAIAEFRDRLTRLEALWGQALQRFEQERDQMLLAARQDVLKLAVAMGEMVTKRSIEVSDGVVVDQLRAVLERVANPTRLLIRIHPSDRATVERVLPSVASRFGSAAQVEIKDDESLEAGSVLAAIDGRAEIDASIRTQLQRIVETLIPGDRAGEGATR